MGGPATSDDLEGAARRIGSLLRSRRPADLLEADRLLAELGDEAPEAIRLLLRRHAGRVGRALPWHNLDRLAGGLSTLACVLGIAAFALAWQLGAGGLWAAAVGGACATAGIGAAALWATTRSRQNVGRHLAPLLDGLAGAPGVDVLSEALCVPDRRIYVRAGSRLAEVLPNLTPREAMSLSPDCRLRLYRALEFWGDPKDLAEGLELGGFTWQDYDVAVLALLRVTGDTLALPYVEHIRSRPAPPEVAGEVGRCHALLRALASGQDETARLLRPAEAPEASAHLLRPATGSAGEPPELLLRPADSGERTNESGLRG